MKKLIGLAVVALATSLAWPTPAKACWRGCGCGWGGGWGCGWGGGWGWGGYAGGWGGWGGYGWAGLGGYGYGYGTLAAVSPPAIPVVAASSRQARLVVTLPEDAELTVDGHATRATSATREFRTPTLDPGTSYVYDLKARVVRDGRTHEITRQVRFRPGDVVQVTLELPPPAVAQR